MRRFTRETSKQGLAGMKRIFAASVALAILGACGDGNPFTAAGEDADDETVVDFVIPPAVAGNLVGFSFNADTDTLNVTGLQRDGDEVTVDYVRNAALDRGEYRAFTFQDDPLDEHTTVYVRQIGAVSAATAVTGGQFGFFTGGVSFERSGAFDPIQGNQDADTGLVSYSGDYIGLSDLSGPGTDIAPVGAGVDPSTVPSQASVVTGRVFINVEFETNEVAGIVSQRQILLGNRNSAAGTLVDVPDLLLAPGQFNDEGNFASTVEINTASGSRQEVGEYAGVIGGPDAEAIGGGLFAEEHFDEAIDVDGEEEYGIFVLGRCGTGQADHGAECAVVDPE